MGATRPRQVRVLPVAGLPAMWVTGRADPAPAEGEKQTAVNRESAIAGRAADLDRQVASIDHQVLVDDRTRQGGRAVRAEETIRETAVTETARPVLRHQGTSISRIRASGTRIADGRCGGEDGKLPMAD